MFNAYILLSQDQQWAGKEGLLGLAGGRAGLHEMHEVALCKQPGHTSLHRRCTAWVRQGQEGLTRAT